MGTIVVGFDGSENAHAALAWALDEAVRRQASVRVVQTWAYPVSAMAPGPFGGAVPPADLMQGATVGALASTLDDVIVPAGVTGESVVREGSAAAALCEEAAGAELLVVGARGHGGFVGLLVVCTRPHRSACVNCFYRCDVCARLRQRADCA